MAKTEWSEKSQGTFQEELVIKVECRKSSKFINWKKSPGLSNCKNLLMGTVSVEERRSQNEAG